MRSSDALRRAAAVGDETHRGHDGDAVMGRAHQPSLRALTSWLGLACRPTQCLSSQAPVAVGSYAPVWHRRVGVVGPLTGPSIRPFTRPSTRPLTSPCTRPWIRLWSGVLSGLLPGVIPGVLAGLSIGGPVHALQVLDASDGVSVEGVISIKEPTRIRIEGAAITDVVGNIHTSHCGHPPSGTTGAALASPPGMARIAVPLDPAGELVLECDRDRGEVYIRPVGAGDKPINLFVSSAAATYTLLLRRADVPADTLLIRDKTPRGPRSHREGPAAASATPAGTAPHHVRVLKAMLVAMASDSVPHDIRVEETMRPVRLWSDANFSLLRVYEGRGLLGELYVLQNSGAQTLDLAEQQFDRPDGPLTGEVVGVAIDRSRLAPGESTRVYVIRRGGTR